MIKKLFVTMVSMLALTSFCYAEEVLATQEVEVDMSGIALIVNKQPENTAIKQTVKIQRSGLIFVINVNGKVEIPQKENK